ncbi:urease accessory protein UreF [Celeribacter marinus]|uniref:urease accessory protein UreF n=1 Tax=Celeribacter marinus TaxID=1397108 RepID=UPI003F6B6C9B
MTDASLLTLTQWLSPAFPVGAFAYSHGLELAVSDGHVRSADDAFAWLEQTLTIGGGKVDAWLLSMTLQGADADDMAQLAQAVAGTRERWEETVQQGTAFAKTVSQMTGVESPARALPVAVGVAARTLDLAPKTVIALYLSSYMSNLVSAGVRFVPLGQTDGQVILARLHPLIDALAERAVYATQSSLTTSAFAADLASARHEDMDVRIFKT